LESIIHRDVQLKKLGWGGRRPRVQLSAPGQVEDLKITEQGEGWLKLQWRKPSDSGAPSTYYIQRRIRSGGTWAVVGSSMVVEATLEDQQRGCELEYRVVAVNKAGDGPESNTVMAVL